MTTVEAKMPSPSPFYVVRDGAGWFFEGYAPKETDDPDLYPYVSFELPLETSLGDIREHLRILGFSLSQINEVLTNF